MARRASNSSNILIIAVISIVLIAVFAVGVTFIFNSPKEPFNDLPLLSASQATANGNSLRGNNYRLLGKIEDRWVQDKATGINLSVQENGVTHFLFVVVPSDLETPNLEREIEYAFAIKVSSGGILLATGVESL